MADDDTISKLTSTFTDLLKWAVGTKSIWAIVGSLVVGLVGAIVAVVFVVKGRALAKKQHEAEVAKEEAEQKKEDLGRERNTKIRDELGEKIKKSQADVARLNAEIKGLDKQLEAETKKIKEAVSWKDLP